MPGKIAELRAMFPASWRMEVRCYDGGWRRVVFTLPGLPAVWATLPPEAA